MSKQYTVRQVAEMSGVSIRTLHHYDKIALLKPSCRTAAGYRVYTNESLERLQQILAARAWGLSLEKIRALLDEPNFDRKAMLIVQREALLTELKQTEKMIASVNFAIELLDDTRKSEDLKNLFEGFEQEDFIEEVQMRWGGTDLYKESRRRTQGYLHGDWNRMEEAQKAVFETVATLMTEGVSPSDISARSIAEEHRLFIDQWFYPCSRRMHLRVAEGYENDPRFVRNIDKYAPGLTQFLVAAISANLGEEVHAADSDPGDGP